MENRSKEMEKLYQTARITSRVCVTSPRLTVREDYVKLSDGKEKIYHIVSHPGASAILPIDSHERLFFIRQYRHAVGEILLEIPAGIIDPGEDAKVCAERELREETGMNSNKIEPFAEIFTTPGFSDEKLFLFTAHELFPSPLIADDSHEIDLIPLTIEEALQKMYSGEIKDAKTIIAIFHYYQRKS